MKKIQQKNLTRQYKLLEIKKESGITMIALVISIIILAILATVSLYEGGDDLINSSEEVSNAVNDTLDETNEQINNIRDQVNNYTRYD